MNKQKTMKKFNWIITIKGDISQSFIDAQTKRKYIGTVYDYGKLLFTGTEEELDDYEDFIFKHGIKIIGTKLEHEEHFITNKQATQIYLNAVAKEMRMLVEDNEVFTERVIKQQLVTKRVAKWYLSK